MKKKSKILAWIISLRLRTLPLALSTVLMGSIIAYKQNAMSLSVLTGAVLTTLFLQILSNLSNDYGDAVSGADNEERKGPLRMIQTGIISLSQMKNAMIIFALLSLVSGLWLLYSAFDNFSLYQFLFFLLGIAAIAAAVKYTVGKKPYGYYGFGDLFVFVFFGLIGVAGTWFLHTNLWEWSMLLPASTIGFFSVGVLNVNNVRDRESDIKSNKKTMAVILGEKHAKYYHLLLLLLGWCSMILYLYMTNGFLNFMFSLFTFPLFVRNGIIVFLSENSQKLDNELRNLSLSTLLFVLLAIFN